MKHPYVVVWLAEGCVVQALPTPRGRRNALLLNRGLVTAVLRLHEGDYQELLSGGPVSSNTEGGGSPSEAPRTHDNGRGARTRAAGRSHVGLVPSRERPAAEPA